MRQQTTSFDQADQHVRSATNLEDLKERLDQALEQTLEYLPYTVPTFGGAVPYHLNGVHFNHATNENNFLNAWNDSTSLAVVSWDSTRFMVLNDDSLELQIISRQENQ